MLNKITQRHQRFEIISAKVFRWIDWIVNRDEIDLFACKDGNPPIVT